MIFPFQIIKYEGYVYMANVSAYLNFNGKAEEAFAFYKSIFGGEFTGGINRFGDMPAGDGMPVLNEKDKNLIMHVELRIMGGFRLMGCDVPESLGFNLVMGNNIHLNLEPSSREEADRLFHSLSEGGKVEMPMQDTFWGAYYGSFRDKFGVQWMINYANQ